MRSRRNRRLRRSRSGRRAIAACSSSPFTCRAASSARGSCPSWPTSTTCSRCVGPTEQGVAYDAGWEDIPAWPGCPSKPELQSRARMSLPPPVKVRLASRNENKLRELARALESWDLGLGDADRYPAVGDSSYYDNDRAN